MRLVLAQSWFSTGLVSLVLGTFSAAATSTAALHAKEAPTLKEVHSEAWNGQPFGVGKLRIGLEEQDSLQIWPGQMMWFQDNQRRTHYPAIVIGDAAMPVNQRVDANEVTVYFLFQGNQPLDIELVAKELRHTTRIVPGTDAEQHQELLDDWWRHFSNSMTNQSRIENYPPHVENYLVAMLARRMNREVPRVYRGWSGTDWADEVFGSLIGAESVRLAMQKDTVLKSDAVSQKATLPLPAAVGPPAVTLPEFPESVAIEALAHHVPAECFYIRCRSLNDFRWLRGVVEKLGADVRHLSSARALDYDIAARLEQQLALRETVLARWFGDAVIADVAVIGSDTFFREGAAVGVLMQARDSQRLQAHVRDLRTEALAANSAARAETMQIAGHPVSLISTPDNSIRSFYVISGDMHLITTSRTIARRFLEAGSARDSLAQLQEFRYARHLMPLSRDDAVFVYLSDPFFRALVAPTYRVEMTRRMQADADLQLIDLAQLAARGEGRDGSTLDVLRDGGYLPPNFGARPDGSRPIMQQPVNVDSLRGARGSFLPVPDVEITGITQSEHDAYMNFARMYERQWTRMDPVIVAIQRSGDLLADEELVTIDVHITPYAQQHYGMLPRFLGTPDKFRVANVTGGLFQLQAVMKSKEKGDPQRQNRIFGGICDFVPRYTVENGMVKPEDGAETDMALFAGETGRQIISPFISSDNVPPSEGYTELSSNYFPKWVYVGRNKIATAAFQKSVLEKVVPDIAVEPAERDAQIRFHMGDLAAADLGKELHAMAYFRARQTSASNTLLLHSLMQQLRVPPEKSLQAAQQVLASDPVCPLGGEYQLMFDGDMPRWQSTAWQRPQLIDETDAPADYRFPLIEWMRGIDVEFSIDDDTITTHTELRTRK